MSKFTSVCISNSREFNLKLFLELQAQTLIRKGFSEPFDWKNILIFTKRWRCRIIFSIFVRFVLFACPNHFMRDEAKHIVREYSSGKKKRRKNIMNT